jgi:hypothetical protein
MFSFKNILTKPPIYNPKPTGVMAKQNNTVLNEPASSSTISQPKTPPVSNNQKINEAIDYYDKKDKADVVNPRDQDLQDLGVEMGMMEAVADQVKTRNRDATEEGHKEAIKESVKGIEQSNSKLDALVKKATKPLLQLKTVWPFDFFPSTLTIDINQVNVIHGQFFMSDRRYSISIDTILDVLVDTSPFFASLRIVDAGFKHNDIELKYLKRADAMRARRLIQGLVIASKQKLDLLTLPNEELLPKLEEIGKITVASD